MPLSELRLISRIRRQARGHLRKSAGKLIAGIGDDCAVVRIPQGHEALVTTDFSIEGVHFRREWHRPESIGHRCLARGLSDIAAMGGDPVAAFLSLALPASLRQKWVDQFFGGFLRLARKFKVPLAGGDVAESRAEILADIVVLGSTPKGTAILRSGARPGDRIYVTGRLGASAAALARLLAGKRLRARSFAAHFSPEPRINVGKILRENKIATAMIDISDGLSTDLSHICQESGVGAEILQNAIPRAKIGGREIDLRFALQGGEDYELLFTARPKTKVPARLAGIPVTCIGEIVRPKRLLLITSKGVRSRLKPRGWQHFQRPSADE